MAKLKLKYVNEYIDRTGRLRRYFRRGTTRGRCGCSWTDEFMAAIRDICQISLRRCRLRPR